MDNYFIQKLAYGIIIQLSNFATVLNFLSLNTGKCMSAILLFKKLKLELRSVWQEKEI